MNNYTSLQYLLLSDKGKSSIFNNERFFANNEVSTVSYITSEPLIFITTLLSSNCAPKKICLCLIQKYKLFFCISCHFVKHQYYLAKILIFVPQWISYYGIIVHALAKICTIDLRYKNIKICTHNINLYFTCSAALISSSAILNLFLQFSS